MKILIVAATKEEISVLNGIRSSKHELEFLIAGIGMVSMAYELTKKVNNKRFDLAINCGIAGSFDRSILIGEVVSVNVDILSELGAEDGPEFLSTEKIGLEAKYIFKNSFPVSHLKNNLKTVRGITVNTVHGNESTIHEIISRYKPQVESMEGASFFFVCEKENIPSLQLRAISNYVERRNKNAWNIPLALEKLKQTLENMIEYL